ncbi:MAG TPA: hypothetical protein VNX40_16095 [Mucilaginibacter sp.]|jgi:hypothetical protein|nr:hypothetical protein [Mucilaginibacter sp.]
MATTSTGVSRVQRIDNPLTLIGVFASIAEVSATTVLHFLDKEVQKTFVWFVMAFPFTLVLLFFTVLLFKHENLYSPAERGRDNFQKSVDTSRKLNQFVSDIQQDKVEKGKNKKKVITNE